MPEINGASKTKLIEVALPLAAINVESVRRKQKAPKGFPTTFHKWWAQRPLAACRGVIFASLVDDPSARPDRFPTEEQQRRERERLLKLTADLIQWDNSWNETLLTEAWAEILESSSGHPPEICDPFCGSGSIPLEAQRLGLKCYASDLNPVAVLMTKALVEIPARFRGHSPVSSDYRSAQRLVAADWCNASGLAEDVRRYAEAIEADAKRQIGHLYPEVQITSDMAKARPELKPLVGQSLTIVASIWARTVRSPNPAFSEIHVPLASTFMLSAKKGREVSTEPIVNGSTYRFHIRTGSAVSSDAAKGTKIGHGANFRCIISGSPISSEYVKTESKAKRLGVKLIAAVAENGRSRVFLDPTDEMVDAACRQAPESIPHLPICGSSQYIGVKPYGIEDFCELFTDRQLIALETFSKLIRDSHGSIKKDAIESGLSDDERPLESGGTGARAYADAVVTYLACAMDRMVNYGSVLTSWLPKDSALRTSMPRQALAMVWDFAEANPFGTSSGGFKTCVEAVSNCISLLPADPPATVTQRDAQTGYDVPDLMFSTDPPYYDNVPYSDLSDFFYLWLRTTLKDISPHLFATVATPKAEELVAFAHRFGGKDGAEEFFLNGMTKAMGRIAAAASNDYPITIYYAFKQSETDDDVGTASTGWETFLQAVISAGLSVHGTWPLRTESPQRIRAVDSNALASSIVLVCRPVKVGRTVCTRRQFLIELKSELPRALIHLQEGNIAPVDLAQAAIGPGMAVYTRYAKVLDAEGNALSVREALSLINQVLDESLSQQEGDFDSATRWALAWFDQFGFAEAEYGIAEMLSKAKNTSIGSLVDAGIVASRAGRVRLVLPSELSSDWTASNSSDGAIWESVHHLIRELESKGEMAAAELMAGMKNAEAVKELPYRLYTISERRKWTREALSYNSLVQSWSEISQLSSQLAAGQTVSDAPSLFESEPV